MSGSVQDRANSTRCSGGMALIRGRMGSSRTQFTPHRWLRRTPADDCSASPVSPLTSHRKGAHMALPDLDGSVGHSFGLEIDGVMIKASPRSPASRWNRT